MDVDGRDWRMNRIRRIAIVCLLIATLFAQVLIILPKGVVNASYVWGGYGSEEGQFNYPSDIAVDGSGYVYVADAFNNRIQKFTSDGIFQAVIGTSGYEDGQFNHPYGVYADNSGVYVADCYNHRIQKFNSAGEFQSKWGSYGAGLGQFNHPFDVAVYAPYYTYIIVADHDNYRVQKISTYDATTSSWGNSGSGEGDFNLPFAVAVDGSGNIYVTDNGNNRIQKFTSEGTFVRTWGAYGSGNGEFNSPWGIAVDNVGNVYVADTGNSRIQKFTGDGVFLDKWGSDGSGVGQFHWPNGVDVDDLGYVYVADTGNNRIVKFLPEETGNLLVNPGFEDSLTGWDQTGGTAQYLSVDAENGYPHSGFYSCRGVESNTGNLGRLYQDVTDITSPGTSYQISGWIKTSDVTGLVVIGLDYVGAGDATPADGYVKEIGYVSGTQDWTFFQSNMFTLPDQMPSDAEALWFLFDFNNGAGTAWFDDVALSPCNLVVNNFVEGLAPTSVWSYTIGQGEAVVGEFTLPAIGGEGISVASLEPGNYWIAQTPKAGYDTSYFEGEGHVKGYETSITIYPNEETWVSFVNTIQPWADPSYSLIDITSPVTGLDFEIPANKPIPIQAAWNVDVFNDNNNEKIDLVTGKPTQILVNLQPPETTPQITNHIDIHISGMGSPNGYDKAVPLADYQTSNNIFILSTPIVPVTGSYVISGYYTADDGQTQYPLITTPVAVKDTVPLALYYTTLSRPNDYGTENSASSVYGEMVTKSNDFIKATYPLNLNTLTSDLAWKTPISGSVPKPAKKDPLEKGMSIDCTNVALAAYNAYGKSGGSYVGIGIGPMITGKQDYFTYHGRPGAGGIRFAGVKGVLVLDGCWDAAAHEIGHVYNLYVPPGTEEYKMSQYQPDGKTASGVSVQAGKWVTGYDFMGYCHYKDLDGTWVNHDTYESLFKSMLSNPQSDPGILWVSGSIDRNGVVDTLPWYYYNQGFADTLDQNGNYALKFFDANNNPLGTTRFDASFIMQVDPLFRWGQDINLANWGTVNIDFAPFAFATAYPPTTARVEVWGGHDHHAQDADNGQRGKHKQPTWIPSTHQQ